MQPRGAVVITFTVRCCLQDDPDKRAEAERIIANVVASTADEPGAISYNFYRTGNDPCEIILVETYTDNEAFLQHNTSPYMLRFRDRFADLFDVTTNRVDLLETIAGFNRPPEVKAEATDEPGRDAA